MNIKKYEAYFHDGVVIEIEHKQKEITFSLSSAEIDPDDFKEKLSLSNDHCLTGKLHLKDISKVFVTGKLFKGKLTKNHDSGSILNLLITTNSIELVVVWEDFPPKEKLPQNCSVYKIIADKIYWESVPDLVDPFYK
jgi:hypothetical protein